MCLRREYTLKATRSDAFGRQCWDIIRVTSCWGRCDSFEIPDWRFPYKISVHPVCIHDHKKLRRVLLRNCDPGADPHLRIYEYYEAETCSCKVCNSSDTFCDWKNHISASHNLPASTR
ncbi:Glycoprotein hormone beta-5, partial [Stegodyphus mimosarum]